MVNKSTQKIFNNSLLYTLGTVASKAVGFILVPICTYNLSKEDYGIATTITTFVSTFGIVIMLALREAIMRFYSGYSNEERRRLIGTITLFVLMNALFICTLLCVFNKVYISWLFEGIPFFPCVFWGILSLGAEGIYLVYQSLLQAKQDGKKYSINSMIYLFFHAVTVVVFVAVLKMGAVGMVLSNFITNLCFALYGIFSMLKNRLMVFCLDKGMLRQALKYSIPIIPHNLSNNLNIYAIKTIINKFLTYAMSGLYTLASQFSTIVNLVQTSVNLAFRAWFVEQMQEGEEGRNQIKYMSCMIMALFSFVSVGVALFSREIVMIMSEKDYHEAWKMVPLFIITQLISFIYYSHVQNILYNIKMSKFTVVCSFSGLAVNVAVSLLLVEKMGIYGILIGQVVSKIVLSALAVVMSNKAGKVDFGLKKMVLYLLVATILSGLGVLVSLNDDAIIDVISVLQKIGLLAIAFFVYIFSYRKDYAQLLGGLLHKK